MARKADATEQAVEEWRYGGIQILEDGRVRFGVEHGPVPSIEFRVQRRSTGKALDALWNGEVVLMFFLNRSRVVSACFNITLDPATLRRAVADLRKTGNGVERWLAPALEWTQVGLRQLGRNPEALKAIPGLLRSLQGVPRAFPPPAERADRGDTRAKKPAKAGRTPPRKRARS